MTSIIHYRESIFDSVPDDRVVIGNIPYTLKKVARGGMGCILLLLRDYSYEESKFTTFGLMLALKAILPDFADEHGTALFRNELRVWSGLQHPNIIRLLDIIDGGEAGWIAAMKWQNGSLRDILRHRESLSIIDCAYVMRNILDGLSFAYAKDKIIHLDLKPENILFQGPIEYQSASQLRPLVENFSFIISDWGIASLKSQQLQSLTDLHEPKIMQQTLNNIGTLSYMAPERLQTNVSASMFSDVFSLGIMYLEMLTGRLPYDKEFHVPNTIISGEYIAIAKKILSIGNIPKPISLLIISMIAYDTKDRPNNYQELSEQIIRRTKSSTSIFAKLFHKH